MSSSRCTPPKAKRTKAKLPKPRIAWAQDNRIFAPSKAHFTPNPKRRVHPVVFLPVDDLKEARARVRFERMGWEEKAEAVAEAILAPYGGNAGSALTNAAPNYAKSALLALGHKGKE